MEPIAIIGLSCLFPGAHTPDEFWRNLLAETDSTSSATIADMGVPSETFYHPAKGQGDKFYAIKGGYVRDFNFDASGYQLSPEFLSSLDSLFQWPLYVAREALRDSGYINSPVRARTGVVLGNLSFPTKTSHHLFAPIYQTALSKAIQELVGDAQFQIPRLTPPASNSLANALISGYPAAIVSQALGLSNTHFALDAACASSLYAIKLACEYLHAGKTDLMLAGAVSCADPLLVKIGFSILQAYPSNEQSRPLDKTSQGLISSEGAGMFVLKRLSDAQRDSDHIYAVLRGIGLSNDGKGKHLLTPNPKGQITAFERAYAEANIAPEQVDYIECHATGTPLGDTTEMNSMEAFFGTHHTSPLIGSAKSNIGHLLTAAGMAGMLKVILGMANNHIPATIKVQEPQTSQHNLIGQRQIVSRAMQWPNDKDLKLAAVSAFGFGGTNAHLIMENKPSQDLPGKSTTKLQPLAITGMAAHFGSCAGLSDLRQALYAGKQLFTSLPPRRWLGLESQTALLHQYGLDSIPSGAYIADFEMDFLHFKIPPNDADQPIPQQLLMLKVADEALTDARLKPGGNVAVLLAMDTELALHEMRGRVDLTWQIPAALEHAGVTLTPEQTAALLDRSKNSVHQLALVNHYTSFIGNIMASRISALWDFSGPAFTISAAENSTARALEVAQMMLSAGEVEAVLVGAVDMAGGIEHVLFRQQMAPLHDHATQPTLSFSQQSTGWLVGEGAGAIVLHRVDQTTEKVYATLEAVACAPATAAGVADAARSAMQTAAVQPHEIGYIEVNASGFAYQDDIEMRGLSDAYANTNSVMGSVKANIGHTFAASGLASLIRATLCLSERYLPGTPGWDAPKEALPFSVVEQSQPWLDAQRVAAVSVLSHDQTCAHFILRSNRELPLPLYQASEDLRLIPIAVFDMDALRIQLQELSLSASVSQAAQKAWLSYQADPTATHRVMLIARNMDELQREITLAHEGVPAALQKRQKWQTPNGSCFTPAPLRGPVAFVYPGAFNTYTNLGQDLFHLFPGLYAQLAQITRNPADSLCADAVYPRQSKSISDVERKALDLALSDDTMVSSGISFATLYTLIMRRWFNVEPTAALGYSLGEAAMMWALGIWTHGDEATQALRTSDLFKTRVAGPKLAVREFWKIDDAVADNALWVSYVLMAPVEKVNECLKDEPHAFITIINTPDEVVLAGDPEACKRVIARLKCHALRTPFENVIHCPPMASEYERFDALHHWPVQKVDGLDVTCYSAANYAPTELTSDSIARNISTVCCSQVDFPRLVRSAYNGGARIFIEMGPHRTCTRWIESILGDDPHLAVNINQKGKSDQAALLRLLAQLAAHHTPVNLAPLFDDIPLTKVKAGVVKKIELGGKRQADSLLSAENRAYFFNLPRRASSSIIPPDIAAEFEPLRRDWQTRMKSFDRPSASSAFSSNKNSSTTPTLLDMPMNPTQPVLLSTTTQKDPASVFLSASQRTLSPELLKLLENFQRGPDPETTTPPPLAKDPPRSIVHETPSPALIQKVRSSDVIWDEDDLLKYSEGDIAAVFGPEYALIDTYSRRVRLPMPPYLLVSRITKLNAKLGEYKPSQMTTEYDIPYNAWYSVDGQIPWAVAVESGQCDLMLISYLGIDFENKGVLVYRLLDCTITFLDDLPKEGETLRYDISINSYARSGDNLLFFFSYDCYVGDHMVLKMHGGCAGFFSDENLARGKGIILTDAEIAARNTISKQYFAPLLTSARTRFDIPQLEALSDGDLTACFGPQYARPGRNKSLRLPKGQMRMIDRVVEIDLTGGPWGLGQIIAEHDLAPDNWYFPCHFKNDEVMAGSLMAEGCGQFMQFFMLHIGLHTLTEDAYFQPIPGLPQVVRCRGQVTPTTGKLIYRMEITEIGLKPHPYTKANVDVILNGKVIVNFKDLGLQLVEKNPSAPLPVKQTALYNEQHINEFALGSLAACFGPEYAIYDTRRAPRTPNGDLQLISRIVSINGTRGQVTPDSSLVSEYDVPENPWFYQQNATQETPYSILMEIGLQPCGFLSAHLGSTLPYPEEYFYFRDLDGNGKLLRQVDLRGQTISNQVRLLSSTAVQGVIIQKFAYELSTGGQPFFAGEAVFGYFQPESLVNQVGLDRGNSPAPLARTLSTPTHLDLRTPDLFRASAQRSGYRLSGGQLHFLDEIQIIPNGGRFAQGYVYGYKIVNPQDWFFKAHFHQDPVMPGSLGVEAMLQAMQAYALHMGIGKEFHSPRFAHAVGHNTIWKYRGQIVPDSKDLSLDIHIKKIETAPGCITLHGEASLWKEDLRIYEVNSLAITVTETI